MGTVGRKVRAAPGNGGLDNVMDKRHLAAGVALAAVTGVVASCTSASVGITTGIDPTPDPYRGIEWSVREFATTGTDHEFDENTGEVVFASEPSTHMKTGDGAAVPDSAEEVFEASLAEAREDYCEEYIDPAASERLWSQGLMISMVLLHSARAAVADRFSDELIEAHRETEAWLEENGFSFPPPPGKDVSEALDERSAAEAEHWEVEYPHLVEEHTKAEAQEVSFQMELFSEAGVREAQEALVDYCDISLPEDYTFPTPQELEIHLLTP